MLISFKKQIRRAINNLGYDLVMLSDNAEPEIPIIDLPPVTKIHYGCGTVYLMDWLNVDISVQSKYGYLTESVNLVRRHPFKDGSFNFGFSEDFMEHLDQMDQIIFLCEAYRTLRNDGVLRLSFPGLEGILKMLFKETGYETAKWIKNDAAMWKHKHYLLYEELVLLCRYIGYRHIYRVKYGESEYSELKNLDTRHGQMEFNTYVEIVK
jgi:predicted SAM-dependent methyltransferase